jgi:hypothetical protein
MLGWSEAALKDLMDKCGCKKAVKNENNESKTVAKKD